MSDTHTYIYTVYIYIYTVYIYIYILIISIPWFSHDISHCTAFPGEHPNSNGSSTCARNISKPWSAWCASAELFRRRAPRRQLWPVMPTVSANQTEIWPTTGGPRTEKPRNSLLSFVIIYQYYQHGVLWRSSKNITNHWLKWDKCQTLRLQRVTSRDNPTILRSYCIINGNIIVI